MPDSRPVLLVMDFTQGHVERFTAAVSCAEAAARAIRAARLRKIPVMFTRVGFRPGFPEVAASNAGFTAAMAQLGDAMHEGHPAGRVYSAFEATEDEPTITKRRVSAFSGSDLDVLLRAARADSLVLAGILTSGVVLSTLRQAADLDYHITVLSDACGDHDPDVHRILMDKVFPRQAEVTITEKWIEGL